MGSTLRTKKGQALYKENIKNGGLKECPLCTVPAIKEYDFWKIVKNKFPYDLIAKEHDMLLTKRHVKESDLTEEEKQEFLKIKNNYIDSKYSYIIEATTKEKSIPEHFHIHLILKKD